MRTVEYCGDVTALLRSHPWVDSSTARYLDLRADPSLVRTALEDFLEHSEYPAIERFYALLEWVNGPTSRLESNDCAFTPPHDDGDKSICEGRVIVIYRELARNLVEIPELARELHVALAPIDATFELGLVGTTITPVRFRALDAIGSQLMISFWAWGDSEVMAMASLSRVIANLMRALRR